MLDLNVSVGSALESGQDWNSAIKAIWKYSFKDTEGILWQRGDQLLELKELIGSEKAAEEPDKQTRRLLNYLFTSTRGGFTRPGIIRALLDRPHNAHQMVRALELDYKSIQHHIKVLEKTTRCPR